jgi:hypothetical protein
MNQEQRTFFLATIESMETTIAAQIKALRAVIALSQNQSYAPVQVHDSVEEIESQFERSIFSIAGDE